MKVVQWSGQNAGTLCLLVYGDSQQFPRIPMQHGLSFRIRASHLLDFFGRHPVAQIERIVGADHDVIGADHAFQILDRLDAIDKIVEVEIL
jgi:hypothetical protein